MEVQLYGLPNDTNTKFKTRPCRRKTLLPRWNAENRFSVEKVLLPSLALLRLHVLDYSTGRSIGHAVVPVSCLTNGYHHVFLDVSEGEGRLG